MASAGHGVPAVTGVGYTEQSSWLLFLKYLDALERDRALEAMLQGHEYRSSWLVISSTVNSPDSICASTSAVASVAEYREYMKTSMDSVHVRNDRIDRYSRDLPKPHVLRGAEGGRAGARMKVQRDLS